MTNSTLIQEYYTTDTDLLIKFTSGSVYRYPDAKPLAGFLDNALELGESVGQAFNRFIRPEVKGILLTKLAD